MKIQQNWCTVFPIWRENLFENQEEELIAKQTKI